MSSETLSLNLYTHWVWYLYFWSVSCLVALIIKIHVYKQQILYIDRPYIFTYSIIHIVISLPYTIYVSIYIYIWCIYIFAYTPTNVVFFSYKWCGCCICSAYRTLEPNQTAAQRLVYGKVIFFMKNTNNLNEVAKFVFFMYQLNSNVYLYMFSFTKFSVVIMRCWHINCVKRFKDIEFVHTIYIM